MAKLILETGVARDADTGKGLKQGTAIEVPLASDCCKLDCCNNRITWQVKSGAEKGKKYMLDLDELANNGITNAVMEMP